MHPAPGQNHITPSRMALDVLPDTNARFSLKVDLTDGFFRLPVHKSLSPFLGVRQTGVSQTWAKSGSVLDWECPVLA